MLPDVPGGTRPDVMRDEWRERRERKMIGKVRRVTVSHLVSTRGTDILTPQSNFRFRLGLSDCRPTIVY